MVKAFATSVDGFKGYVSVVAQQLGGWKVAEQQEILTINVRTPSANVDWLKRVAAEQDRSMNYVASKLITEARERDQQAKAA